MGVILFGLAKARAWTIWHAQHPHNRKLVTIKDHDRYRSRPVLRPPFDSLQVNDPLRAGNLVTETSVKSKVDDLTIFSDGAIANDGTERELKTAAKVNDSLVFTVISLILLKCSEAEA